MPRPQSALRTCARWYPRLLSAIFLLIASGMLMFPDKLLAQDGVDFVSFPTAGKAEVRAYYVGTALCVSWCCWCASTSDALFTGAVVLGDRSLVLKIACYMSWQVI